MISYAWLQRFGLSTDGSADSVDNDNDRMNNWQEWRTSTIPTNAASLLKLGTITRGTLGLRACNKKRCTFLTSAARNWGWQNH